MSKKIIICGKNGQVASALKELLGDSAINYSKEDVAQFTDYEKLLQKLNNISIKAIINAAAYTAVDKAEQEQELAHEINAAVPENLAKYCAKKNIPLIHYSTDYVFDGQGQTPRLENEPTNPLNIYGKTKLEGESKISESNCNHLIFRTSWVCNSSHNNFITTMLRLAKEREELGIVSDQIGAPTYAKDLAKATIKALENALKMDVFPSGIYHLCNKGETSWYNFAIKIFELARKNNIELKIKTVNPIPTSKYPTPAKRPLNSRLNCSKAESVLNITMPDWQESLEKTIENI